MMNHQESEPFEWYIFEGFATESSPVAERAVRLGPFATESECHTTLESIRHIPSSVETLSQSTRDADEEGNESR
jgi:hypothetical protein